MLVLERSERQPSSVPLKPASASTVDDRGTGDDSPMSIAPLNAHFRPPVRLDSYCRLCPLV
jgi:hypothetical protein